MSCNFILYCHQVIQCTVSIMQGISEKFAEGEMLRENQRIKYRVSYGIKSFFFRYCRNATSIEDGRFAKEQAWEYASKPGHC